MQSLGMADWVAGLTKDTYPEDPTKLHEEITKLAIDFVVPRVPGRRVLDIGCGQGVALKMFRDKGFFPTGTGVNDIDLEACKAAGFTVVRHDMHRPFRQGVFDLIWMRHVLEHSPVPMYVMELIKGDLVDGGLVYVEVPMPDTDCHHETNINHYTVLTQNAWESLFERFGWEIGAGQGYDFQTIAGKDRYAGWILKLATP